MSSSSSSPSLALIVACSARNGIGKDGGLPWRLPKEMAYFKKATMSGPAGTRNAVIMGRNTWESIPTKFRPLNQRLNIVVTSRDLPDAGSEVVRASSLQEAVNHLRAQSDLHHAFIIGGAKLYSAALEHPSTQTLLMTRVLQPDYECDTFFPSLEASKEWEQASYADLLQWVGLDKSDVAEETEEKGATWVPQMWTRTKLEA